MATGPILTLREVVNRLGRILELPRRKSAVPELHRLLKLGELKAGFEFPGKRVYWIPIPPSYWTGVSSHRFRSLYYAEGDQQKKGSYEVRIGDFVDEYIRVVSKEVEHVGSEKISVLFDELKTALSAALRRYEVGISFGEWQQYLQRNQITEPATHGKKSHAGRPEKKSWSRLAPIVPSIASGAEMRNRTSPSADATVVPPLVGGSPRAAAVRNAAR